jgi:galactokinase
MTFVISQTFVAADKHTTGPVCYNLRVVECSLAAVYLAKSLKLKKDLPEDSGPLGVSLRGFQNTYFEQIHEISDNDSTPLPVFKEQLKTLVDLTKSTLMDPKGYTREEVASVLEISVDDLNKRYTSTFPIRAERFLLRQRALHVFTEALRVLDFMELLESPPSTSEDLLRGLGDIMNATQTSCREVYDCSCPELDELCVLARGAGSCGSRLTGAGWGGCCIHLVPQDKVEQVKEVWEKEYYRKKFPDISPGELEEAVVVSKPGSGSCVFNVTGKKLV